MSVRHRGPVPQRPSTRSRPVRWIGAALLVVGSIWWGSAPVGAAGGVELSVNPVPVAVGGTTPVTVRWTGQRPRTLIFIRICVTSVADPSFNEALDCSLLSEVTPNGSADGSGSAPVSIFRGPDPGGDNAWGCFAKGDQPPPGITPFTTCFVRVTNNNVGNREDDAEAAFTIVGATGAAAVPTGDAAAALAAVGRSVDSAVAGSSTAKPDGPASISLTG